MGHYVKNKDLLNELMVCRDASICSDELIDMFYLMAERFSHKLRFREEAERQDGIQVAVMDCFQYRHNFNPEKSNNPFAYFTQVIKNGFAKSWKQYHKMPGYKIRITEKIYNL